MKSSKQILITLLLVPLFFSCKKQNDAPTDLASVNIVNATVNLSSVKVNYINPNAFYAKITDQVSYGANKVYSIPTNKPRMLDIVSSSDTLLSIYHKVIKLSAGNIYSLYLAGQSTAVDTILLKDNIPYRADSTAGVRFMNLSYNSTPVNVTLSTTTTVNEFNNIAYKGITDFKTYPALKKNTSYVFQIRDGVSNALLTSYTLTTPRFFNCTLLLKGITGGTGTNALGVMRVNNY
jgi:hypothetical protein